MVRPDLPSVILWEITYACPLRCHHCYSESGVRPSRQLPSAELRKLAGVLASMRPRVVHVSGGEPVIVRDLIAAAEILQSAGVAAVLTTSGFGLGAGLAREIARVFHSIHVSVDGTGAAMHDAIRGRSGSFDAALIALGHFDELSRERRKRGESPVRFGIDYVVLRSNFDALPRFVAEVASRFGELEFVIFNGVVPQGLASRAGYQDELLSDEQARLLIDPAFAERLQSLAAGHTLVMPRDNLDLRLHPDLVRDGTAWTLDRLIVEPDGMVRAMEVYEGVVGNLLEEPPEVLWARSLERRNHPFVIEQLAQVRSSADWAEATRRIDARFASAPDLVRIAARKPYAP